MKKNIGSLDAFCRLTIGLSALGLGVIKKSFGTVLFGALFAAEGITKFCPFLYYMGMETCEFPCFDYDYDDDDDCYDDSEDLE